jgi:acetamidase/formamidase
MCIGPNVEEATKNTGRRIVDFAVGRTGLNREEASSLVASEGELRVGTLPHSIMATRLIVPEEQLGAAG